MMQGTIGQDAYMMPVKNRTNCVQDSSYDQLQQQQPSKQVTSEYCSLFSNHDIGPQRNRQCRTDFLRGCMAATTFTSSIDIIGSIAPPAQETTTAAAGGKQTMSALVQACSLFSLFADEVTEIDSEDDWLDDDISGIFEELKPFGFHT
jgi:hypothetical protein